MHPCHAIAGHWHARQEQASLVNWNNCKHYTLTLSVLSSYVAWIPGAFFSGCSSKSRPPLSKNSSARGWTAIVGPSSTDQYRCRRLKVNLAVATPAATGTPVMSSRRMQRGDRPVSSAPKSGEPIENFYLRAKHLKDNSQLQSYWYHHRHNYVFSIILHYLVVEVAKVKAFVYGSFWPFNYKYVISDQSL